jgi:hypothetical protein
MKAVKLSGHKSVDLIIKGQGIYLFDFDPVDDPVDNPVDQVDEVDELDGLDDPIKLVKQVKPVKLLKCTDPKAKFTLENANGSDGLKIVFTNSYVNVSRIGGTEQKYLDPMNNSGLSKYTGAYYWFSLDAQNQIFYAGVGEARIETVIYTYVFEFEQTFEGNKAREVNKQFLESIVKVNSGNTRSLKLVKDPICQKIPLKVIDSKDITMEMLCLNDYMPVTNLPLSSQKLYNAISGPKIVLDDNDFPQFSQAIEQSIKTPGLWCFEKLKEKSTEFNKDKPNEYETYLRITLGQNNGESPGIPYVMEIWPSNHYSPIHSHAGAEAIIRILYGSLHASLYPFLCGKSENSLDKVTDVSNYIGEISGVKPFGEADFGLNEFTWVSPGLNQTHQLKNTHPTTTCISLNCYLYDNSNSVHYDYFDYVDSDGVIKHYEPDSDMDFINFKKLMKQEWYEQGKKRNSRKLMKFNTSKN